MPLKLPQLLKVLADPTRLRIVALLGRQELTVGEVARSIAVSQSRVSNHLKVLRENGMLHERREGAFTWCRIDVGEDLPQDLWGVIDARLDSLEEHADDLERCGQVLEERRRRSRVFFDRMARRWDVIGRDFARGTARLHALGCLVPAELVVADVGCGTGYMAEVLARRAARVICVDHSAGMLAKARENLGTPAARLEMRRGELDELPLADGEVGAVCGHMVLHHLVDPTRALGEMLRVLAPGGVVALTDLLPHRQAWMEKAMGDVRLGLDRLELARCLKRVGFVQVCTEEIDDRYLVQDPAGRALELEMFLACGRKAAVEG